MLEGAAPPPVSESEQGQGLEMITKSNSDGRHVLQSIHRVMNRTQHKLLIVSCDMPSHVYASAKLARVYATAGHEVTVATPEGFAIAKMKSLVEAVPEIRCVSVGKTATVNQINQRPITDPFSYRTLFRAMRNPFPEAVAIANMITFQHEGLYEPLCDLIRRGNFTVIIPMHSVSAVVCDAFESVRADAKLLIFSSMPYDPATYLPPRQTWRLPRSLSTFLHVSAYSSRRAKNILVHWQHQFWKALDTWMTARAWKKSEGIVNACRQKRGLEPISNGYIGYQRKYPSLVVGGIVPFVDESFPISPMVTVVGTLDDATDEREPVEGELKEWLSQAESGIVYVGYGTGTKLNENEAVITTGHLFQSLQEGAESSRRILFALRVSEQKRLRSAFDQAFGSSPSAEGDEHLEYMEGRFRIQANVPQASLLNSGQVNVFVSHMGMGGFIEGSQAGVPFVCCPSGCDQYFNAARAVDAGIGILVGHDLWNLSECVQDALRSKSMRERSQHIARELHEFDGKGRAEEALEKR